MNQDWIAGFIFNVPLGAVLVAVGCVVLLRGGWNPIGWLLAVVGVLFGAGPFSELLPSEYRTWFEEWWVTAVLMIFAYMMLVFPSGRLPTGPGGWARLARVAAATLPIALLAMTSEAFGLLPRFVGDAAVGIGFAGLAGGTAALLVRFKRSRGEERAQLSWVVAALVLLRSRYS